jgi:hypothetical protein
LKNKTFITIPYVAQTGELLARAVFAVRKGILSFEKFIDELKLAKVIGETGLNADELLLVKDAFNKAQLLAKDEKLLAEIEKAIEAGDFEKLKKILNNPERLKVNNQFLPKDCEITFKSNSFTFKDKITNETVGLFEINNGYLEIAIYRKGLKTNISGQQAYRSLMEELRINKIEFKGIRGLWNKASDNTAEFNKAIQNSLPPEKAAFETWSGKRALENGFDRVKIDLLNPETPPYTNINVTFYN